MIAAQSEAPAWGDVMRAVIAQQAADDAAAAYARTAAAREVAAIFAPARQMLESALADLTAARERLAADLSA